MWHEEGCHFFTYTWLLPSQLSEDLHPALHQLLELYDSEHKCRRVTKGDKNLESPHHELEIVRAGAEKSFFFDVKKLGDEETNSMSYEDVFYDIMNCMCRAPVVGALRDGARLYHIVVPTFE